MQENIQKPNMRKVYIIITLITFVFAINCTLFFSFCFFINPAHATSYTTNNASGTPADNTGSSSSFSSSTNKVKSNLWKMGKDYVCADYNINIDDVQKIECNLIVAARNFNASFAQVEGDVIVAAENINTQGIYAGNNLFASGNNVDISASVTNETAIFARQVTLSGSQPLAHVWADTVVLSGNFKNVDIYANRVIVQSNTVITGKLSVTSAQEPQIETGAYVNNADYKKSTNMITGSMVSELIIILSIIFSLLGTFVCGLLLLLLFRTRPFNLAAQKFSQFPARVLLTGLLTCIFVPIIACILLISGVGIKSMLLLVAFAFCLGLLSLPFTALALARRIFKNLNKWGGSILMLLIVGVLASIPYLCIAIYAFCTLFTVGSIVLCFFDWRNSVKQSENNNPPNPDDFAGTKPTPPPLNPDSPQVSVSPQASLPHANKNAAAQPLNADSHTPHNMEQLTSNTNNHKDASNNGKQNANVGELPASKSDNNKNNLGERLTTKSSTHKNSIQQTKTMSKQLTEPLSKQQSEASSRIAAALEQEDSAMLDGDIEKQHNIKNPAAYDRSKDTSESKKGSNSTNLTATDFIKWNSSTNNLEQPNINNETTDGKNTGSISLSNMTISKNKPQITEENLSPAEAILAKLAQEAILARNGAQTQNSVQGTQNNAQQMQVRSQVQAQQTSDDNSEQMQRHTPKLDREAQVQAILDRLQKQQNSGDE